MRRAVPCVDGGVLGHQICLALRAHFLGKIGVLHIHKVPLVKAAHGLESGSVHRRKAAGAELDLDRLCQILVCHQVAVVVLCPKAQTGQLTVDHGAHIAPAQRQLLGSAVREGQPRAGHHHAGVRRHPVGKVAQGICGQLDIRVEDKVHPAVQQREHRVVPGAEAAVLQPAEHLHGLPGGGAQSAVLCGSGQPLAAVVRAGVIHQIQRKRVAAGAVQHGLRGLDGFLCAVIHHDAGRKLHLRFPFRFSLGQRLTPAA